MLKDSNENDTYPVLQGTVNEGASYEIIFISSVVLELVLDTNIKDFSISSNNENFVPFDDAVIETETVDGIKEKFAVQLKYGSKRLSIQNLVGNDKNFNIKHYFEEIKKHKISFDGFKFIIFTNRKYDAHKKWKADIKAEICNSEKMFRNFSDGGASYKFTATGSEEYKQFVSNFFLYSDQLTVKEITKKLSKIFQNEFGCGKSQFLEYLHFIVEWSKKGGQREKLNKTWMKEMIGIRLLSPFVHPISYDLQHNNEKIDIFRRSIIHFDITVFEEKDHKIITEFWSITKEFENLDVQTVNKLNNKYQICEDINKLDDLKNLKDSSILLWLLDKCPLIIKYEKCIIKAIQFLKQKKFIILSRSEDVKDLFFDFKVFRNLSNLRDNLHLYQRLTETFKCSLQGKEEISLEALTGGNRIFEEQITTNDLLLFLNDDFMIGEKEVLPNIYIERYFTKHIFDCNFLSEVGKDTLVVVSNFNPSNRRFKQFHMLDIDVLFNQDSENKEFENGNIYFCKNDCSHQKFEKVCKIVGAKRKYHHFRMLNEKLEWICSRGGVENLKQFQTEEILVKEKELGDRDHNIIIICGDPGIGKTVLMKNFKNCTYPTLWTELIYPKNHSAYFNKKETNLKDFENYILADREYKSFTYKVVQNLLNICRVNFIWDGLDEISGKNLSKVLNTIEIFSERGLKQCLTSRNNLRNELEKRFSALATTLRQFDEQEQKYYIKTRLQCSNEELENIFTKIQNNFFKYNEILSLPLQIYMFIELFYQDQEKYNLLLTNNFSLSDLYKHYISEKFNIYFKEKENSSEINDIVACRNEEYKSYRIEKYQLVALQTHFSDENLKFWNSCERFLTEIRKNKDSIGIITGVSSDNIANFVHNSYGEYFAACYLSENYENIPTLSQFFFKEKYKNIRFFFDLILAENCPAHIAVLCKNLEALKKYKDSSTLEDLGGRNPLQLACSWGDTCQILTVTKEMDIRYIVHENEVKTAKNPNSEHQKIIQELLNICAPEETDRVYNLNSYSYADETLNFSSLAILSEKHIVPFENLKNYKNIPLILYLCATFDAPSTFFRYPEMVHLVYNQHNDSLLGVSAINGSTKSCKQLLTHHKFDVNATNLSRDTPLFNACVNGHSETAKLLIKHGAKISPVNLFTLFYPVCKGGYVDILKLLIDNGAMLDVNNDDRASFLYIASRKGHAEIVKLLIENGVRIDIEDRWGDRALNVAIRDGHVETVRVFINNGAPVNADDRFGATPLELASWDGNVEIAKMLIDKGAMVNFGTPLHMASNKGYIDVVRLLIDNGANVNATNTKRETPLDVASRQGHQEIVNLLLENGAEKGGNYDRVFLVDRDGQAEIVKIPRSS